MLTVGMRTFCCSVYSFSCVTVVPLLGQVLLYWVTKKLSAETWKVYLFGRYFGAVWMTKLVAPSMVSVPVSSSLVPLSWGRFDQ